MLKHARFSERESHSDLQIASENACRPSWRQVGRSSGWSRRLARPSGMLKMLSFLSARAILTCKLRVEMHVGRLGGMWAARLINRPWVALETCVTLAKHAYARSGF